jgi:hypothetical protein
MTPSQHSDFERQYREKRAALVKTHDDGAISTLEEAVAGNAETECMAYCLGGSPKVDIYEVLADLAEEGWRLVRAETTTVYTPREHAEHFGCDHEMRDGFCIKCKHEPGKP